MTHRIVVAGVAGVAAVALALSVSATAFGAGGRLDSSFGQDGQFTPSITPATLAWTATGSFVVAGAGTVSGDDPHNGAFSSWATFGHQLVDGAGVPVSGYGGDPTGTVVSTQGLDFGEHIAATSAVTDSAGRLWVVGTDYGDDAGNGHEVVVERYLPSGALDRSFGAGGVAHVEAELPAIAEPVAALLVEPDGRAVVVLRYGLVFRLMPDGAFDTAFGLVDAHATLTSAFLDDRGRIVTAGQLTAPGDGSSSPAGLAVFSADGVPDASFGTGGRAIVPGQYGVMAAALAPGHRAILAGSATVQTSDPRTDAEDWATRVDLGTGAVDPTFGDHGNFVKALGTRISDEGYYTYVHALAVGRSGAAILGGGFRQVEDQYGNAGGHGFVLRLTPDGDLDTAFGTDGVALSDPGGPFVSVALDGVGRVLAVDGPVSRLTSTSPDDAAYPDPVVVLAPVAVAATPGDAGPAPPSPAAIAPGGPAAGAPTVAASQHAAPPPPLTRIRVEHGRAVFGVTCPRTHHGACAGRVRLALGQTTLATRSLRVASGKTIRFGLDLGPRARRRLARAWHTVTLRVPWTATPKRFALRSS